MLHFVEHVPVDSVRSASYNPRKITPQAKADLENSLRSLGMVKPIIVNVDNNVILAGHQRRQAALDIGLETVPAIFVRSANPQSEVIFNIMHNSIETSKATVKVSGVQPGKFTYVPRDRITILKQPESVTESSVISSMIARNGEWGSAVCDEMGNVILNAEYVATAVLMGYGSLVYCIPESKRKLLLYYLSKDYGEYCYDVIPVKTYAQSLAQPTRFKDGRKAKISVVYENFVIPEVPKDKSIFDLGAGKMEYANYMRGKGYRVCCYEPSYRVAGGKHAFDLRKIVSCILDTERNVRKYGLFDVCVLDSVVGSVANNTFEDIVIMTTNAMMKKDGVLYTGTRSMTEVTGTQIQAKTRGNRGRFMYFLDDDGYGMSFKNGIAYKQKFHTVESFTALLSRYYEHVEVIRTCYTTIHCKATGPRKLDLKKLRWALNEEFNIEYPNGYRHNRQGGLVEAVIQEVKKRDGEKGSV